MCTGSIGTSFVYFLGFGGFGLGWVGLPVPSKSEHKEPGQ